MDLLTASRGLEAEVVSRAPEEIWNSALRLPVARREELLALKILSMTEHRAHDRADALALRAAGVDDVAVFENLRLIQSRGYARQQDLEDKYRKL